MARTRPESGPRRERPFCVRLGSARPSPPGPPAPVGLGSVTRTRDPSRSRRRRGAGPSRPGAQRGGRPDRGPSRSDGHWFLASLRLGPGCHPLARRRAAARGPAGVQAPPQSMSVICSLLVCDRHSRDERASRAATPPRMAAGCRPGLCDPFPLPPCAPHPLLRLGPSPVARAGPAAPSAGGGIIYYILYIIYDSMD